jgi:hypothetical protein
MVQIFRYIGIWDKISCHHIAACLHFNQCPYKLQVSLDISIGELFNKLIISNHTISELNFTIIFFHEN